jgi:hypothetical protein
MANYGDHQLSSYVQGMFQRCLLAELDFTLALSGYANHRELNRDSLVPA